METLDSQLLAVAVLTTGVGAMMAWLGARAGLLEARSERRRCPSCGRVVGRVPSCPCVR